MKTRTIDPVDMNRGEAFAEALHVLANNLGPKEWTPQQRHALASHLVEEAVKFARRGAPSIPAA